MDFTREPVIETVITPKEGCKLVIRNSKGVGQEEYFVDSVEVITFGSSIFFRSIERPKPFIVPASDYEVLEVREARIVLKNVGIERNIKIGGGRESTIRAPRETHEEKPEAIVEDVSPEVTRERLDRKKDRRRQSRRRRELPASEESLPLAKAESTESISPKQEDKPIPAPNLASLLAPPPLISETISRYKEQFKDAFYTREEQEIAQGEAALPNEPIVSSQEPVFGTFEVSEEADEEIFRQRTGPIFSEGSSFVEEVKEEKTPENDL